MNTTKTPAKTPKNPAAGSIAEQVKLTIERLNLSEARAADYFGVPVHTLRKWLNGTREPAAAVARLIEVLGMVEALAPALHASLIPAQAATPVRQKRSGAETPL